MPFIIVGGRIDQARAADLILRQHRQCMDMMRGQVFIVTVPDREFSKRGDGPNASIASQPSLVTARIPAKVPNIRMDRVGHRRATTLRERENTPLQSPVRNACGSSLPRLA